MRTTLTLAALLASSTVLADPLPAPQLRVRGETIIIEGHAPPKVQAKPVKNYFRIAPAYSDYAIEHDKWGKAWLLLDISDRGTVTRVKLLKHPGYDLDQIAVDTAFKLRFAPAQDDTGHAIASSLIWPIEWPAYWWMIDLFELATRVPDEVVHVPCLGSGPMHMGSIHPVYRDCETFKMSALETEPWITK
ncbi:MAG TPA: energy transducer TonB [Kofleriaceae bacterium]|nr:energy transducer TonB [Kofleriaceae bacterium]